MENTYDAIVIGAGIVGSHAAYELARREATVLLVDGDGPGTATAAGAGIVQSLSQADLGPAVRSLLFAGAAEYGRLDVALHSRGFTDWGYARPGAMLVSPATAGDAGRARLEELRAAWEALAWTAQPGAGEVELIDGAEARRRCPVLGPVEAALLLPGAARVDGRRVRETLRRAFESHGGVIVRGFGRADPSGCSVGSERFSSGAVLVTAGAWTTEVLGGLAPAVAGCFPRRGEILHLRVEGGGGGGGGGGGASPRTEAWPSVSSLGSPHYLVGFEDGRVAVGGTRDEVGFDARVTAGGLKELACAALDLAPGLAGASLLETRVGLRPMSDDGLPVVGRVRSVPSLLVGTGLGHSGLHMGPAVGRRLADLVTGGSGDSEHPVDWSTFDPERGPARSCS